MVDLLSPLLHLGKIYLYNANDCKEFCKLIVFSNICRMLSYDPCDPYRGFFLDTYKLPSGCSCHIPDGPAPASPVAPIVATAPVAPAAPVALEDAPEVAPEAARSAAPEASAAPVIPEPNPAEPTPAVSPLLFHLI